MGRFDGVLLVSDFDNTLVYTDATFGGDAPMPQIPPRNRAAIAAFQAEGGLFTVATGRSLMAISPFLPRELINAPAIVDNGANIHDFAAGRTIFTATLPAGALEELGPIVTNHPEVGVEIYHTNGLIELLQPNRWSENHAKLTGVNQVPAASLDAIKRDELTKVVFFAEEPIPARLQAQLLAQGAGERYEMVVSNVHLLEITGKGAHKGAAVLELARLCGVSPHRVCCVGDHANDLPMLRAAARAFAPANAIEAVRTDPAVTTVGHCREGAIADVVALLEELCPAEL